MHDLVIKGGTLVDGTGAAPFEGDVAVDGDSITSVGDAASGRREIDARGKLVLPGWVDVHTHYDAQVTWDPYVTPSSWHGVTTLVMGNCGVGFAPAKPDEHQWLIGLMEGVEDIPGAAMTEGMQWEWESFPEYMDAIEKKPRALDIGAQVPHGALRAYVMGQRGAKNAAATEDDIAKMAAIVEEGIRAGALGFSTSRTLIHKGIDGELVPGTFAAEDELFGIAQGMKRGGAGVFQMTSNHTDMPKEIPWMRRMARELGLPVSFNLVQSDPAPELWRDVVRELEAAANEPLYAQVAGRPAGVLMSWAGTAHPFLVHPTYMGLHWMPIAERLVELRKPEVRAKIVGEDPLSVGEFEDFIVRSYDKMYRLGADPEYEPDPSQSAAAIAQREGRSPRDVVYDWLMENDGWGIVYFPIFNYSHGHMDHLAELLEHPRTCLGLSDGGAHCGVICDASIPTYLLTHWARDRSRGRKLALETVVHTQTAKTAALYGLADRGQLAPGLLADINVVDHAALHLEAPRMAFDLPADGRRLVQRARGYDFTLKNGQVIFERGEPTGALPGKLLRGRRAAS